MAGSVKNYRRFYAAFKKVPHYGDEEEQKEALVSTYTKGRTSHLREMTTREYTDMCKALENMCGYGDQRKRHRSICLHLMQELGVNTGDRQRINDFCSHPRICGKVFARLDIPELEALERKLRAIKRKGGLGSEERRVKSEEFSGSEERRVKSEEFSGSEEGRVKSEEFSGNKEQNINQSQVILLGYEQQRRKSQPS